MSLELNLPVEPFGPAAAFLLTDAQVAELGGGKRAAVKVTVEGRSVRVRLSVMGGKNCIGFSKANRDALGIAIGDEVLARIELDSAPREVAVPAELTQAMASRPVVIELFNNLTESQQNEFSTWVSSAKQQATRDRRAAKAVDLIAEGKRTP